MAEVATGDDASTAAPPAGDAPSAVASLRSIVVEGRADASCSCFTALGGVLVDSLPETLSGELGSLAGISWRRSGKASG